MAFHCFNCGGHMVFDVASQLMRCEHCDTTIEPSALKLREDAIMTEHVTCQNCGAELEGTEDSLVGFCPYCGGQSLVRAAGEASEVEAIVPFKVTKESCVELYQNYTKGVPYLAKEFKDTEYLDKFLGIYMPYHAYDVEVENVMIEGMTSAHHGRTTINKYYDITVETEGDYLMGAPYDASKYLSDELSDRVMPFDMKDRKAYHPAYLSGFYADASTTPASLYELDAARQAFEEVQDLAIERATAERSNMHSLKGKQGSGRVFDHHLELFPYWFINWRNEDRIAYAAINGQTGKVISDLPLNMKSFAIGCVAVSLALFALLEFFVDLTVGLTAFLSMIAAALMAWQIYSIAQRLHNLETHAEDKGFTENAEGNALRMDKRHKKDGAFKTILLFFIGVQVFVAPMLGITDLDFAFNPRTSFFLRVTPVAVLLICLFVLVKVVMWHKVLKEWNSPVAIGSLVFAVFVCAACILFAPPEDIFYYIAVIITDIGLITSSVALIRAYNISTTRPIPKIYDRKEV